MAEASRSHHGKRTAQECKVQWIGTDHPLLQSPANWDEEDDKLLFNLVGDRDVRAGAVDWVELAKQFKVWWRFYMHRFSGSNVKRRVHGRLVTA